MQPSSVAEDVAYSNAVQLASIAATVSELIPSGGPYLAWCFWVGARALFSKNNSIYSKISCTALIMADFHALS